MLFIYLVLSSFSAGICVRESFFGMEFNDVWIERCGIPVEGMSFCLSGRF